jgi:ubiquinone/menaquinone biosynthesis C-methylase UbiE
MEIIEFPTYGKVLDLSCGDGQFLEMIHLNYPELILCGIDISEKEIKKATKNYEWGEFSSREIDSIPYDNNSFDVIFCNMALHHYRNPQTAIKEMYRLLKPNGSIYILDHFPENKAMQTAYNLKGCDVDYHFEKYYTVKELEKILKTTKLYIKNLFQLEFFMKLLLAQISK